MLKFQCRNLHIFIIALSIFASSLTCNTVMNAAHAATPENLGGSAGGDIPLVVVRFNQPRVFFEKPLHNAVVKALSKKPSVMFDVVSFVPQVGNQTALNTLAAQHTQSIVNALHSMGVNPNNITTTVQPDASLEDHEVQIFIH